VNALKNISLSIKAGSTVALVGKSGSGKSTLASLILRFYDPSSGSILWDGLDLKDVKRSSLRSSVSVVLQQSNLFNISIHDNIAYGKLNATKEEVIAAAILANAHDFIIQLPNQYDSVVGEKGVKLSGGQKQRIAIARSLISNPSLLIFDESTSNLDTESERVIQESMKFLRKRVTQLVIAHRLSTIIHSDMIVLLEEGKIIGTGTHRELLKNNKTYQKLYNLQFDSNENEDES